MYLARVLVGLAVLAVTACSGPSAPDGAAGEPGSPGPGAAVPLPDGLEPADRSRLTGRWVPAEPSGAQQSPYVELTADGAWSGSDGCNGSAGRWTAGDDGVLLATSGASTLMACAGMVAVPAWFGQATRAAFDGETLVLLDAAGTELGRLTRA